MRIPVVKNGIFFFNRLDNCSNVKIYSVGWRFESSSEVWTKRFLSFKNSKEKNVLISAAKTYNSALKIVLSIEDIDPASCGILTALSSRSTISDEKSNLYIIGEVIAKKNDILWIPKIIEKEAHRSLHSLGSAYERDAEVSGKYSCVTKVPCSTILILDDFVTRGSTINEIARAIRVVNPNIEIILLVLGKNEKKEYAMSCGYDINNDHIDQSWNNYWI